MKKAKFKKGDTFFHPEQKMFVTIDDKQYFDKPNKNGDSGWLYRLKCYTHKEELAIPWKSYYENRVVNELQLLNKSKAVKVLYGDKKRS